MILLHGDMSIIWKIKRLQWHFLLSRYLNFKMLTLRLSPFFWFGVSDLAISGYTEILSVFFFSLFETIWTISMYTFRTEKYSLTVGTSLSHGLVFVQVLPCVCVSGSLFRGLLRSRLSGFFPPGLPTPPPDPADPSVGPCDLLLHTEENHNRIHCIYIKDIK